MALNAAASGETRLRLTDEGGLEGCRVVPIAEPLSWKTDWVKADCLYVVTGATGAVASTLLPTLAKIGVRHFLLLVHRRRPSHSIVKKLYDYGANSVNIEQCDLTEEPSIRTAVQQGLKASGAGRVAGVVSRSRHVWVEVFYDYSLAHSFIALNSSGIAAALRTVMPVYQSRQKHSRTFYKSNTRVSGRY